MSRPDRMILLSAFLLVFVVSPFLAPRATASLSGSVIRVPYDFPTIQEAIDASSVGGVVLVASGTYPEHIAVNKSISLLGEERTTTIIAGDIYVEADNVQVNGFTIRNGWYGVHLNQTNNCKIENNILTWQFVGVFLENANESTVLNNVITLCGGHDGMIVGGAARLSQSFNNTFEENVMIDSGLCGLDMYYSSYNLIRNNVVANTYFYGVNLDHSDGNMIHHNAFVDNQYMVELYEAYNNTWEDGNHGNFWDTYTGVDDGSNGRIAGDGVGDTGLPCGGLDNYPLVCPSLPIPFVVGNVTYLVSFSSNSTVSTIRLVEAEKKIVFNMAGPNGTSGYCNLTIPKSLLRGGWKVTLDAADISSLSMITENYTHTLVSFGCGFSTHSIQVTGTWIIPESPSIFILLFLILSATASYTLIAQKLRTPRRS